MAVILNNNTIFFYYIRIYSYYFVSQQNPKYMEHMVQFSCKWTNTILTAAIFKFKIAASVWVSSDWHCPCICSICIYLTLGKCSCFYYKTHDYCNDYISNCPTICSVVGLRGNRQTLVYYFTLFNGVRWYLLYLLPKHVLEVEIEYLFTTLLLLIMGNLVANLRYVDDLRSSNLLEVTKAFIIVLWAV